MTRQLTNWVKGYLAYTYESRSPEVFHQWIAISVIAAALRRSVFYRNNYFNLYPNMYIVLVSPPGRCKKSTAMRIGRGIMQAVPIVKMGVDSTSRERFITDISAAYVDGQSPMTTHSSEFASLFTTSGMDMVVFLTDIYDSPDEWTHRTKSGGTSTIKFPCLNLLAGTTPDWITRAMPLDTVGIGLTSRIIHVYSDTPRIRDAFADLSPEQLAIKDLLAHDLNQISQLNGEYIFSPEAKEFYRGWELEHQKLQASQDPRMSGYWERKPMHVIKVAMALSAATGDDMILQGDIVQAAIEFLNRLEEPMEHVFAGIGRNSLASDYDAVRDAIYASADGLSKGELLERFKHNLRREDLDDVVDTLIVIGEVGIAPGGKYRRVE